MLPIVEFQIHTQHSGPHYTLNQILEYTEGKTR